MRVLSRHPSGPVSLVPHRLRRPQALAGHPHGGGGQVPQVEDLPAPEDGGTAQPHPVSPLHGQIPPPQLVQHRVDRGPAGQLQ